MARKQKKKGKKKRHLKYGNVSGAAPKEEESESGSLLIKTVPKKKRSIDFSFKKELTKNLVFVGVFFVVILIIYFLLAKTNLLNPVLQSMGIGGLY